MNKLGIKDNQFEELRERLYFTYLEEDLDAVGAFTDRWSDKQWASWNKGIITDNMVNLAFSGYSFVDDDFWCTANQEGI